LSNPPNISGLETPLQRLYKGPFILGVEENTTMKKRKDGQVRKMAYVEFYIRHNFI
jgi:hypothetical protein